MDRVAKFLRQKRLLVTGATGFLGQPLLEKILWAAPEVERIHVLIRPKRPFGGEVLSSQERLEREIFPSSVFDRLRDRYGEEFETFLAEKVVAVAGDISRENLGIDPGERAELARTLDVIINSAAVVSFDAPLDEALELNTLGSGRVASFASECDHALLVHVSTAYVCGATNATIPETIHHQAPSDAEEPFPGRQFTDPQLDIDHIRGLIDQVREEGQGPEVRRELIEALVKRSKRTRRTEPRREMVENLRRKWIENRLVEVGMTWARQRGWNDTYTYTKALGEQMVLRHRGGVPTVILRPAIIESSLLEPSPGWLDGLRMADPLIAAIGKGRLRALPLDPGVTLDLVPADMVVNALVASIPKIAEDGGVAIYQIATGSRNPIRMQELHGLIVDYFQANPMLDKNGEPIEVKPLKFPSAQRFRREYKLKSVPLETAEKLLDRLVEHGFMASRAQRAKRQIAATKAALDKLYYYGELYLPYLNLDCRFDVSRTMTLHDWLDPEERRRYNFDVTRLNWRHYIQVHIAGVKKYILKIERAGTLELDGAAADRASVATIPDLLEHAVRRYPDRVALQIRRDGAWHGCTYAELRSAARAIAGRLRAIGLEKGDRIVLWSENQPEWGAAYFGASCLGLVVVPLDAQTWHREVWSTARFTGARAILASRACFQRVPPEQLADNERAERTIALLDVDSECRPFELDGFPRAAAASAAAAAARPLAETPSIGPDDPASIIFTTSTAVDPKGAVHTHRNFLNNLFGVSHHLTARDDDRFLSVLPLYHALEFSCGFLAPIYRGATVTYARSLKPKVILETMRETGTSIMLGVPTLYSLIRDDLERRIARDRPRRSPIAQTTHQIARRLRVDRAARQVAARVREELGGRIRIFVSGGSALGEELYLAYRELGLTIYEGYGLTETAPVLTVNPLHRSRAGSAGKPLPGVELRLFHTNADGVGEIIVRTPSLMTGYYKNPRATERVVVDGWFHTGDLGWVDTDGYLYITGRIKDVIVTGAGKNVYPMDLESIYRSLVPVIREIVVVGVPSGLTEDVHAVVVPDKSVLGELPEEEARRTVLRDIQAAARGLPSYHRLQQVHLWEALPRDEAGPIDREEVRRRVRAGAGEGARPEGARPRRPSDRGRDREAALIKELARLARVPPEEIRRGTHLYDDLGLDSLLAIELLLFLEHELGVALEDEAAARLETVGDLMAEIETHLSEPSPAAGGGPAPSRRQAIRSALPHAERRAVERWLFGAFRTGARAVYRAWFDLDVEHPERLPRETPYLIAANHASHLDAPAVLAAVEVARGRRVARKLHVLGARDYFFDTWLKRWFFSTFLNAVPIEREETSLSGLRLVKSILASGESALIFPEGTRSRSGEIQSFKPGLGLLAWELQVPIVPVHIGGTHAALPVGKHVPRRNRVRVTFGEPITMDHYREIGARLARDELYRRIAADVRRRIVSLADGIPTGAPHGVTVSRPDSDGTR